MRTCTCDLCKNTITGSECVSFPIVGEGSYDFCKDCVKIVRRAICRKCKGTGIYQERDAEASDRQATCGENRTKYRMVSCQECR